MGGYGSRSTQRRGHWLTPACSARCVQSESEAALTHVHFRAEGDVEFRALLYIPAKAPYNFMNDYYGSRASLKLYVRRVFISDDFEELIPRCARMRPALFAWPRGLLLPGMTDDCPPHRAPVSVCPGVRAPLLLQVFAVE